MLKPEYKRLLSYKEIEREYNLKRDMVEKWILEDDLPRLINTHKVLVKESDLIIFIDNNMSHSLN